MQPEQLPIALFAFFGLVAVAPAITYYTTGAPIEALPVEAQVLAAFAMPLIALLFLASYIQPG